MNIIGKSNDMNVRDLYFYTMNPLVEKMVDHAGETIEMDGWVIYDGSDTPEKIRPILCVKTTSGTYLASNSATFVKAFQDIVDLFNASMDGEHFNRFKVCKGTSKGGREFITCMLD